MKSLYIILIALLCCNLASCYDDKGNYDYTDIFEISIDSIQERYSCLALLDTLNITPEVAPKDVEYEYFWGVYANNTSGITPILDTLCKTCELHYPVQLQPGSYTLVFCAREKETGIASFEDTQLQVATSLTSGWYILRSQNAYTDLDLFASQGKIENVIASNNGGKNLKGEAETVLYTRVYRVWDAEMERYQQTATLMALSSDELYSIRASNGSIIRTSDDFFYERPDKIRPQNMIESNTCFCLINNNRVHTITANSSNSGRFGVAKTGNYKLSPYIVNAYPANPLVYDENSNSFCRVVPSNTELVNLSDEGPVDTIALPSVNNLDADLLFMGIGANKNAWALMKKKNANIYILQNLQAGRRDFKNPTNTCDTIDSNLKICHADSWAPNLDNDIIYFSEGNSIYSCNVNAYYQEREQVVFPAGEEVTHMRHLKYSDATNPENNFSYLVVATYLNGKYKVYLYNIQAGNLQNLPQILEGEGKVGGVVYINNNLYTKID